MVRITENLIRKRAEHNNCEIATLEELSLHQSDIERIEHLDRWCRELKILYLQSNLIPKIENVSRMKKLEYLNLALNNVLLIENLEGCESLNKLDLTVNFVARLTSVENLRSNEFLRDLYLTGNPCTEYVGYREYVIATLPQLSNLDGTQIIKSDRITATQKLTELRCDILRQEKKYFAKLEKENPSDGLSPSNEEKISEITEEEFWSRPTKFTPESRVEAHRFMEEKRKEKEDTKTTNFPDLNPPKRVIRFFNDEGRPLNINQEQVDFRLTENEEFTAYTLDVACYRHLDTSLLDVDVQPNYARVTIKGKILQLALSEEVSPDKSSVQRSQTSGHLVLTMPKLKYILDGRCKGNTKTKRETPDEQSEGKSSIKLEGKGDGDVVDKTGIERLEVSENNNDGKLDYRNIVIEGDGDKVTDSYIFSGKKKNVSSVTPIIDEDFVDDLDVPPLM